MFIEFFYLLRARGLAVSPTGFLRLQEALRRGLVGSLDDLYAVGRALMVKSERQFDLYDRVFASFFEGLEWDDEWADELDAAVEALLREWLNDPRELAEFLGVDEAELARLDPEELEAYFRERLKDQDGRHDGGNRWIGTGGTSPVGHGGHHPGGMRVGGESRNQSAVKVALDRRYKDYTVDRTLGPAQMGEALKRLRNMVPAGPRDRVSVERTICETMKNAGEIEIVFDRDLKDRLKVMLLIDNGGFSMDPYIEVVQVLFNHARAQFRELTTRYFHNTIYDHVWTHPGRRRGAVRVDELVREDPETRVILVGDASMSPWELYARHGNIYYNAPQSSPSIKKLELLAKTFPHSVWLNPKQAYRWSHTESVEAIREIFPMVELTLDGLEQAVDHLMQRR